MKMMGYLSDDQRGYHLRSNNNSSNNTYRLHYLLLSPFQSKTEMVILLVSDLEWATKLIPFLAFSMLEESWQKATMSWV